MGDVFAIQARVGSFEYQIQYLITGILQIVQIDLDKQDIFSRQTITDIRPMACPFLRKLDTGVFVCSVYHTRPEFCRIYFCSR